MLWWLPLAAAQCAIVMHARAIHSAAPLKQYKPIESRAPPTTRTSRPPTSPTSSPKLADPVAEQHRLLNERPIYMDEAHSAVGAKLIDL